MGRAGLRTILFTALVPGTIVVVLPIAFLGSGLDPFPPLPSGVVFRLVGAAAVAAGAMLYAASARAFVRGGGTPFPLDPPRRLVTDGPYGRLRNPLYVAIVLILAGEAFLSASTALLLYAAALLALLHLRVVLVEEPRLERRYGSVWTSYRRRVARWLPKKKNQP